MTTDGYPHDSIASTRAFVVWRTVSIDSVGVDAVGVEAVESGQEAVVEPSELRRDDVVLARAEIAHSHRERRCGLLGREGIGGVLVLPKARQVHTFGMRFAIDVAWCDADGKVLRVATLSPNRLGRWVRRARTVLEAEAGAFARWGLHPGDQLNWND